VKNFKSKNYFKLQGVLKNYKMEYLSGSKKEFIDFLNSIGKKDRIGIISHTDLDGIACAILINEALKQKKLKAKEICFTSVGEELINDVKEKFEKKKINKVFFSDLSGDFLLTQLERFKKIFDFFILDHHPSNIEGKNIIKTKSEDCTTLVLYDLLKKEFNVEKWKELVLATAISEFSHASKENFEFIKETYPSINSENIWDSVPAKEAEKIGFALIYFKEKEKKVFNLLQKQKINSFGKYYERIEKEVDDYKKDFRKDAEFYPEKNLYLFYKNSKYHLISLAINKLALEFPEKTIVCINDSRNSPEFLSASFRNQSGKENMNLLVRKALIGLENATGGGHPKASGGRFMKKDLEKFKNNLLK
jgi:oligoribonuclease NrnB/cAMP/cGMP phosphodiesterase (DHH superfamily)